MCGFCGFSGESNNELLEKMGNTIKHRGPDDFGYYSDGKMNLCARRLSIVDLKEGFQPAHNEDSSIIVVFNGEIYNYKELIAELKERGHNFYSDHSDSELLTHLYEEYDVHFVNKLNGMFAIALWDYKKERTRLIIKKSIRLLFMPTFRFNKFVPQIRLFMKFFPCVPEIY